MVVQETEFNLIVLCSRTTFDPDTKNRVLDVIKNNSINWEAVYTISIKFGLLGIVYRYLRTEFFSHIPDQIQKKFHRYYLTVAARNALLSNELLNILSVFEKQGILALPLKGPVLSDTIYGDDTLRVSSDIDIFVEDTKAVKARDILLSLGYINAAPLDKKYDSFYLKIEYSFNLINPKNGINVDLQWMLLGIYTPAPLTISKLQKDLTTRQYGGKIIYQLSKEDLLFYLCVHGTKDGWGKFEWICCIAELLRNSGRLDWEKVYLRAHKERCFKKFMLGLHLANRTCNVPLPEKANKYISKNHSLSEIGQMFINLHLYDVPVKAGFTDNKRFARFHIQVQDSALQKLNYIFRQLFRPVHKDLELIKFQERLTFLYYFSRPLRLLWEAAQLCLKKIQH